MREIDATPLRAHESTGRGGALERRYGAAALIHGYVAVPRVVTDAYADLGVTRNERALVEAIWSDWRDEGQCPRVTVRVLARRLGASTRTVERYSARLRSAGLLRVIRRRGTGEQHETNSYDLRPLIDASVGVARSRAPGAARQAPDPTGDDRPHGDADGRCPAAPPAPVRRGRRRRQDDATILSGGASDDGAAGVAREGEDVIERRLADLGTEWGDPAAARGAARARALHRRSGLSLDAFLAAMDEAGARTRARTDVRNRIGYLYAVLGHLLADGAQGISASRTPWHDGMTADMGAGIAASPALAGAGDVEAGRNPLPSPPMERTAPPGGGVDADCADPIWRDVLAELRLDVTEENYRDWLAPAQVLARGDDALRLGVATQIHRHWLDARLRRAIERVMSRLGRPERLEVVLVAAEAPQ